MTVTTDLKRDLKSGRWRAFSIISTRMKNDFENLSSKEKTRINQSIVADLVGPDAKQFVPETRDRYLGDIMYCVLDTLTQIRHLEYHLHMVRRNPFKKISTIPTI